MKCRLEKDINKCPFYKSKTFECDNKNECSFQESDSIVKEHNTREERWYEKYYQVKK